MKVVVVGGGVIGLSVAWRAARAGLDVRLVDPDPAQGAARVAAGMLAPVTELHYGEEALLALNLASARRWPDFAAELATDAHRPVAEGVGFLATGTLAVARDRDEMEALEAVLAHQLELGLEVTRLGSRDVRRREPALAPTVRGGVWVAGDHQVEPRRLLGALIAACKRNGAAIDRATIPAEELDSVDADAVVVTAGWRAAELVPGLPIRPVKGQILRLAATPASVLPTQVIRGSDVYLVPRFGELVVGATVEERGADTSVTAGGVADLLVAARSLVPGIDEAELVETGAGLRPGTPDNGPIIGPVSDRVVVAAGHHRNGILLAPATADAVVAHLTGGSVPAEVAPFGPERTTPEVGSWS